MQCLLDSFSRLWSFMCYQHVSQKKQCPCQANEPQASTLVLVLLMFSIEKNFATNWSHGGLEPHIGTVPCFSSLQISFGTKTVCVVRSDACSQRAPRILSERTIRKFFLSTFASVFHVNLSRHKGLEILTPALPCP